MSETSKKPSRVLVGDIGGTNARFALADIATLEVVSIRTLTGADYPNLADAMKAYLKDIAKPVSHAGIAVAAPLDSDEIQFTNSSWSFVQSKLAAEVGLEAVHVFNDFEALSLSLPHLTPDELHQIGGGVPVAHAPKAVLGPGTGLGVAGLVWSGVEWVALPGEGGHMTLGAEDERELALIERLRKGLPRLSAERALSGPGLSDLHLAVAASHGHNLEPLAPADVEKRALSGEDEIAAEALDVFVKWLGRFAGDVALVLGAHGGVYIGGGIAPKMLGRLTQGDLREAFENKGRMSAFVEQIPIYVIVAEFPALTGAAAGLRSAIATQSSKES